MQLKGFSASPDIASLGGGQGIMLNDLRFQGVGGGVIRVSQTHLVQSKKREMSIFNIMKYSIVARSG